MWFRVPIFDPAHKLVDWYVAPSQVADVRSTAPSYHGPSLPGGELPPRPKRKRSRRAACVPTRGYTTRRRILIEDPDPAWWRTIGGLLEGHGFEPVFCPGPEYLADGCPLVGDRACPLAESADVILNSLSLDRDENRAVLTALRTGYPATPVVALTSRQEARHHSSCLHGCTVELLPVSASGLLKLVGHDCKA